MDSLVYTNAQISSLVSVLVGLLCVGIFVVLVLLLIWDSLRYLRRGMKAQEAGMKAQEAMASSLARIKRILAQERGNP
jgi:hypothetical protein